MTNSPWCADNDRTGTVKKLFSGTVVLVVATVITKIIGFLYKVPLVHYVGIEGMAYFLAANHIYVLLFVISTAGLPVAVAVLISEAVAKGELCSVSRIYKTALLLFLILAIKKLTGQSKVVALDPLKYVASVSIGKFIAIVLML